MQKSITTFRSKFFVSHYRKISLGNTSVYQKLSGIKKFYASERGVSRRFSVENFVSHRTEKFRWGTLQCFRKFRVSQNFMHKKGISLNSVEKFLSHSADKIRRRTLLCFERSLVSKIFKQRRGEASRFCQKKFYLTGPKKLRQGIILCFRKFLVGKNILWIRRGGGYHDFPSKSFCLTVPKFFIGEHFGVSEKFFYRKFSCIRGGRGIPVLSKFFVSQDRNEKLCNGKGTLLFSGNFLVSKKI